MPAAIVLHLKPTDIDRNLQGRRLALYRVIAAMAEARGIPFRTRLRDRDLTIGTRHVVEGRFDDGNLHIIDDRSVRAPGVLNAAVAYLWEFWQLDPRGTKAFSSIAERRFDTAGMKAERVARFRETLLARYVAHRRSKHGQITDHRELPEGASALFCQGHYPLKAGATDFTDVAVLRTMIAQTTDRPILVKLHPAATAVQEEEALRTLAGTDSRVLITDANIHDILASCAATVSINSTAALEGFIHRKPAILFGQSDFHHIAGRVHAPGDFGRVLDRQIGASPSYDAFLAWFFLRNCIPLNARTLEVRIWDAFPAAGFPPERFDR